MATSIPASITIGGTILTSRLHELYEAVEEDGAMQDWDVPIQDFEDFLGLLREANGRSAIAFYDAEASWGRFAAMEERCVELGLTYNRSCDAEGEWDAEVVWWAPGMEVPATADGNNAGNALIEVSALHRAIKRGTTVEQKLANVLTIVNQHTPVEVPNLVLQED
jgi:hypothetical protein